MRRRDAVRLIPLTIAGISGAASRGSFGETPVNRHMPSRKPLSERYLEKVREMLVRIRETQSENLLEASYAIARTVMNGQTCWYSWDMGHSVLADIYAGRNGVPEIFTPGYYHAKAREGDLLLASLWDGLSAFIEGHGFESQAGQPENIEPPDVRNKGVFIVGAPAPWGLDAKGPELIIYYSAKHRIRPSADIWIETNVTKLGAVLSVPGMGAPVGPVSGIVGMVTFWMMVADACRILARNGLSVPVRGDDPVPAGENVPRVSLHAPLMDDYFERVMNQIEMIGAEFGCVRQAAVMAVDAVLAGGKVYCYSGNRNALAYESQTRRGGLSLTRGIYDENGKLSVFGKDFRGESRDLAIMGISQPDNKTDLLHLDTFRKCGMKVVSMGPMTRDTVIPDGRTVPKEADLHIGRMCDTYGLFAVPGFERRICPTSGALLNQVFWATCMEIVDEIMRRTGNVPGVYLTGAVTGGIEHLNRVNTIYEERGY